MFDLMLYIPLIYVSVMMRCFPGLNPLIYVSVMMRCFPGLNQNQAKRIYLHAWQKRINDYKILKLSQPNRGLVLLMLVL